MYRRGFDLDSSCKLWLPFYMYGGEQTRIVDQSGNENHGIISGAVPAAPLGWQFDGLNDEVYIPNSASLDGITAATVLLWVKVASGNAGADRIFSSLNVGVDFVLDIGTMYPTPGNLAFYTPALGGWTDTGVVLEDNTWKLIAVSGSGVALNFYVNGSYINQFVAGINTGAGTEITIGNYHAGGGTNAIAMVAGEVAMFNRAFSAVEIRNHYELTRHIYGR